MAKTITRDASAESLLTHAEELTGITDRSALVRAALTALIERESARHLTSLGGSDPDATAPARRGSTK